MSMRRLSWWSFSLGVCLAVGCSPGGSGSEGGGDDDDDGAASPTPSDTPVGGHITADTTWSGAMAVTENAIVDAGVTLTVSSGAAITFGLNVQLRIDGSLVVEGAAASPVTFSSIASNQRWSGVQVGSGGEAEITHAELSGSSNGLVTYEGALPSRVTFTTFSGVSTPLSIRSDVKVCRASFEAGSSESHIYGGAVKIADTSFTSGIADAIKFGGDSTIEIEHVELGGNWHCLLHTETVTGDTVLSVSRTRFENAAYAFMVSNLGSTTPVAMHQNYIDLTTIADGAVSGSTNVVNAQDNYWGPSGFSSPPAGWTVEPQLPSAPDPVGPRAAGMGCESDAGF